MKKNIRYFGIILMIVPSLIFAQEKTYLIRGKIGQLSKPAEAYLNYKNEKGWQMDSTTIDQGRFIFSGSVPEDGQATLFINKTGTGVRSREAVPTLVYLENGQITITSPDSAANIKITGGPLNTDNARLQNALIPVNAKLKMFIRFVRGTPPEKRKSKAFSDLAAQMNDSIRTEQNAIYLSFIQQNPNSIISIYVLRDWAGAFPDVFKIEQVFNSLAENVRKSAQGVDYAMKIEKMKKIAVGNVAPDFTQADPSGKPVSLHDFKGKYVLIDFWASWCGPCRAENPNVVAAYRKYKGDGFTVLGISLDQPSAKAKWLKAIQDDHLTWTQLSDLKSWQNEVARLYTVQAIPQNFLVGPDGKIIAKNLRGDDLNNKLQALFGR